jgi:hypothetical protein
MPWIYETRYGAAPPRVRSPAPGARKARAQARTTLGYPRLRGRRKPALLPLLAGNGGDPGVVSEARRKRKRFQLAFAVTSTFRAPPCVRNGSRGRRRPSRIAPARTAFSSMMWWSAARATRAPPGPTRRPEGRWSEWPGASNSGKRLRWAEVRRRRIEVTRRALSSPSWPSASMPRWYLVSRFRSSHPFAAHSCANFGIQGTLASL